MIKLIKRLCERKQKRQPDVLLETSNGGFRLATSRMIGKRRVVDGWDCEILILGDGGVVRGSILYTKWEPL